MDDLGLEERIKQIVKEKLDKHKLQYDAINVLVYYSIRTVGVQGDERTYGHPVEIGVKKDGKIVWDDDFLADVSTEITNKIKEVNRVTYLI